MGKNSLHDLAAGAFGQNGSVLINSTATVTPEAWKALSCNNIYNKHCFR